MDARFGHDFSSVRIHADDTAGRIARSAGAKALTLGSDIFFGSGRYTPGNRTSDRLLTHELAHVVQQEKSGPGDPTRASRGSDPSEREADKAEDLVTTGASVQVSAAPDAAVARDEDNTCSSNDDDGMSFLNRMMNAARGATTMSETGANYNDTMNQLSESEEFRDEAERDAFLKTEKQAAGQPSSQSSSPAEAPGDVSDVNPSYNAMEPNTEPAFTFDKKLSSAGNAGSQVAERTGVYQESLPGVSDPVAVKVLPASESEYFENELGAARAAEQTGYGPQIHGEVPIPDVNGEARRGFAMEKMEGGFTEAADDATAAERAEAAKWAGEVTPQTLEDVRNFENSMLQQGYAGGGDLQGFVTPGGRWRPVDMGSYVNLQDPGLTPEAREWAAYTSNAGVETEQSLLRPHVSNNLPKWGNNMINEELQGMPPELQNPGATPLNPDEFGPTAQNASQLPPESQAINSSIDDELRGTPPEQLNEGATPLGPADLKQTNIDSSINEELSGPGGAPMENPGATPLNPDEFGNAGKTVSETEELIQAGSKWGKLAKGLGYLNYGLNPLGMVTNSYSMYQDIEQGRWGHAALDAGGMASSTIATAGMLPGVAAELPTLGPAGAVIGAGVGGYAAGEMALNQANSYAKNNNIFGDNRDSTEAAGDAAMWVRHQLGDGMLGQAAGGATAVVSSWGTAAYSGGHAAVSGIESGAGWLYDKMMGNEKEDNNIDIGGAMDQIDSQETQSELEQNMSFSSSAREEMPPLPTDDKKK
jgi:hypothetical protein